MRTRNVIYRNIFFNLKKKVSSSKVIKLNTLFFMVSTVIESKKYFFESNK